MMDVMEEIVFDESSGISLEEQREILAGINGITEKNRLSLSPQSSARTGKRGALFPLLVNAAAAILVAGGFLLLLFLQDREDVKIRQGRAVYNTAERALIEEIRKETARKIEEKEREISLVVSQLAGVDAELQEIQTTAGREAEERRGTLMRMQEEFRERMETLGEERTAILENSREREAALRAQLEERNRELASVSRKSEEELSGAYRELSRLTGERERLSDIEGTVAGYYEEVNEHIENGEYAAASGLLASMKEFIASEAFQGLPAFSARRDAYLAGINALQSVIARAAEMPPTGGADSTDIEKTAETVEELRAENDRLSKTIEELGKTGGEQGAELARRISENEQSIQALRTLNSALEQSVASLESRNADLAGTVAARDAAVRELSARNEEQEALIASLNSQLATIRQALQALSQ